MTTSEMNEQDHSAEVTHSSKSTNGTNGNGSISVKRYSVTTSSSSSSTNGNGSGQDEKGSRMTHRRVGSTAHGVVTTTTTTTIKRTSIGNTSTISTSSSSSSFSELDLETDQDSVKPEMYSKREATLSVVVETGLLLLIVLHVLVAPFTKVEESFNLQATHDILTLGVSRDNVQQYDHLFFPGVVPRTFVGPLFLAITSWPFMFLAKLVSPALVLPKSISGQLIVRLALGLYTYFGWRQLGRGIQHQFGKNIRLLFMIVSSCQFHWMFYAGRTLPNIFALGLVNLAYSYWMRASAPTNGSVTKYETERQLIRMIHCLVFATVLFRSELVILLGPIVLLELAMTRIWFQETVIEGIKAGIVSIGLAVAVDSWFWQRWIWAEGVVFWFNAVEGKSVAWGVSPWHTYFTSLLPKISGVALPLALVALVVEQRFRRYMLPVTVFVSLYSFLGHKEWRFVVYVIPIINLGAAVTLSWVLKRKTIAYRILALGLFVLLGFNFVTSVLQAIISSENYPGGQALRRLHELELPQFTAAYIHIDGAAAETGCSRFGEIGSNQETSPWRYSKNESHTSPKDYLHYTHLLTSTPEYHQHDFVVLEAVPGYAGVRRVPSTLVKQSCPTTVQSLTDSLKKDGSSSLLAKETWIKLWEGCSPVQVQLENKIWIMRRFGAA